MKPKNKKPLGIYWLKIYLNITYLVRKFTLHLIPFLPKISGLFSEIMYTHLQFIHDLKEVNYSSYSRKNFNTFYSQIIIKHED